MSEQYAVCSREETQKPRLPRELDKPNKLNELKNPRNQINYTNQRDGSDKID